MCRIRQVLIESRIVNADESFAKDIGVRFGYSKHTKTGTSDRATIGENRAAEPFVALVVVIRVTLIMVVQHRLMMDK